MIYVKDPCTNSFCSCQYETGKGFKCAFPHMIKKKFYIYKTVNGIKMYFVSYSETKTLHIDLDRSKAKEYMFRYDAEQRIEDFDSAKGQWSIEEINYDN